MLVLLAIVVLICITVTVDYSHHFLEICSCSTAEILRHPVCPLSERVDSFADFFAVPTDPQQVAPLTKGHTIGRPLMRDQALTELEKRLGRTQRPGKRCQPPSQKNSPRQQTLV